MLIFYICFFFFLDLVCAEEGDVRLSEAPSHGKPICAYDRASRGAEAYTTLAAEFLKLQGN